MIPQAFSRALEHPIYKEHVESFHKCSKGVISVANLNFLEPAEVKRRTFEYVLSVHLSSGLVEIDINGRKRPRFSYHHGDFDVTPAGDTFEARRLDAGKAVVLSIPKWLVKDVLQDFAPEPFRDFGALHEKPNRAALVSYGCIRLAQEFQRPSGLGTSYSDHLVQSIILELSRLGNIPLAYPIQSIGAKNMEIVDAYIQDNLSADLGVAELADLVGLSSATFSRHFAEVTGQTPYQYILAKRLNHAQHLVKTSKKSFVEIAFDCGFSSQSHMTQLFKKRLGITPKQARD